jgi:hypothetical protein
MHQAQAVSNNQQQSLVILPGRSQAAFCSSMDELRIDSELKALIPPLGLSEKNTLEASILEEGCRDPLVIWAGAKILIDGHHRHEICTTHNIPYQTVEMSFASRNAVKAWMILNQLGRRNLTPESISYLRGTWYELTKQSQGGDRKSSGHFDHLKTEDRKSSGHFDHLKTDEKLGTQFKASPKTIRRDAEFATAVDTLSQIGGEQVKWKILDRSAGMTKKEVIALASEACNHPAKIAKVLEKRCLPVKPEQPPTRAHHLTLEVGGVVEVYAPDREDVNGRLGRIHSVSDKTATVWLRHIQTFTLQLHTFKHLALTAVSLESQPALKQVCDRINRLYNLGNLDPFELEILSLLERPTVHTPTELQYLEQIEAKYKDVT